MNLTVLLTLPGGSKPGDINKLLHLKMEILKKALNSPYYCSQPLCVQRRWPHKAEPEVGHDVSFKKAGEHSLVIKHLQGSGFNPSWKDKHTPNQVFRVSER